MPKTSRFKWIYAAEEQKSWYEIYKSGLNQQDADTYAAYENPNLMLRGGGTISLNTTTDTLSWTEDFEILALLSGGSITISAGSLTGFEDGKIAYITVARPVSGAYVALLKIADTLTEDTSVVFVAMRRGNTVYFRNHANINAMTYINRLDADKVTTSVITASGGSGSGDIQTGALNGAMWFLKITALGNTVDSTVRFYSDAGLTNELYAMVSEDCYTSSFEERTSWYFLPDVAGKIYYSVTNDGANDSAYEIEMAGIGRIAS